MTIAEVSRKYDISTDTLRYYERIGLIPTVNRSCSGIRDYTDNDCGWVEFIKCMRGAGIPIDAMIEYVSLYKGGDETKSARKAILIEQRELLRARLKEMQNSLSSLDDKIEHYDEVLVVCENELLANTDKGEHKC